MESGPLARSGRLVGCPSCDQATRRRAVSAASPEGAKPGGEVDVLGFLRGFAREPLVTLRAAFGACRALRSLEALA
jgi:hypothetical protein